MRITAGMGQAQKFLSLCIFWTEIVSSPPTSPEAEKKHGHLSTALFYFIATAVLIAALWRFLDPAKSRENGPKHPLPFALLLQSKILKDSRSDHRALMIWFLTNMGLLQVR